ncbi:MAG TPA: gluconate 2-dehydrogenase subunit 3 family protein [Cyclobacteriaceae bacterium]|nr:gluconate 2-dehydrogenase subunit 3 family protein [Cyclobacteriaceae bacterium]
MKRRESIKTLALGAISATALPLLDACSPEKKPEAKPTAGSTIDRHPFEKARDEKLMSEKFFDDHEMATIAVLADIIIPKDETSGSATEAGVPAFIEFIVKDMPRYQLPMRGGLKWLDVQCLKRYNKSFVDCSSADQIAVVDEIAYPALAKPEMKQGVAFFNTMRDLTATGFFTSEIGLKDLGYAGNKPNRWDGVPQDVLDQYGVKYDEKMLRECVKWDDAG